MSVIDTEVFLAELDAIETPDDAEFLFDGASPEGTLRRHNLLHYVELMGQIRPTVMLIGEAPGYRGHTVTGVPFMSLRELSARPGLITGRAEGDGFRLPDDPVANWEASSAVVWKTLARWRGPLPLIWSSYPNHPFHRGSPLGNRTPRPAEVRAGIPIALELARAFSIETFVAVGRKAQGALAENGVHATAVRHPAQGGAVLFAEQLLRFNSEHPA
jgi:hypothetical protein